MPLLMVILMTLLLAPLSAWAVGSSVTANCQLKWTGATPVAGVTITGYQIFLGTSPGVYPATPSGAALATEISKPCAAFGVVAPADGSPPKQYYVAMKTVARQNVDNKVVTSIYSPEVPFMVTAPTLPPPNPPTGQQVIEFTGTIQGTITIQPTVPPTQP